MTPKIPQTMRDALTPIWRRPCCSHAVGQWHWDFGGSIQGFGLTNSFSRAGWRALRLCEPTLGLGVVSGGAGDVSRHVLA